jgi:hypothetical protein
VLCNLDALDRSAIPCKPEGFFAKKAKFAAARHVPRGGLWCEQRRVGFNISDKFVTTLSPCTSFFVFLRIIKDEMLDHYSLK